MNIKALIAMLLAQDVVSRMDASIASANPGLRGDSGAFFARQLEVILPEVLRTPRAPLDGFRIVPIGTSLPPGADTYIAQHYDEAGRAKLISNWADDLPSVELNAAEDAFRCASYGVSAQWSLQDIAAAQLAGRSISSEKMSIAIRAIEEMFHNVLWDGDAKAGLHGLLTYQHIPKSVLAQNIADLGTPDAMIAALNEPMHRINKRTHGRVTGKVFRAALPIDLYNYLATTPRSSTSDTTILEFWTATSPFLRDVVPTWKLGAEATQDKLIYLQPTPDKVRFEISRPPSPEPVQMVNLAMVMPFHGRTGGMYIPYPREMEILEMPKAS